jgi:hypothetical protein
MDADDRKMFAPLRNRESISLEAKLLTILSHYAAGTIAARLAEGLVRAGLAVGTRGHVTRRVGEILGNLEEAGRVERTADGRFRAVRISR